MKHFAAVFLFYFAFSLAWLPAKDPAQTVTVSGIAYHPPEAKIMPVFIGRISKSMDSVR